MSEVMDLLQPCGDQTSYHHSLPPTKKWSRFKGTVFHILKTYALKHLLLSGYREVPQESSGFSSFKLLFR